MFKTVVLLLFLLVSIASSAPRNFGFQPLEIYTFKNGTSRLIVTDLNKDGLDDILFANNHVSRLEILLRKPSDSPPADLADLEECFEDRGMIVDQSLKSVRVADLNNDGLPDLITFGTAMGLQIRYQQPDGSFSDPNRIFIKDSSSVRTIQVGPLNEDDLVDIMVCRKNKADLHWNATTRPFLEKKTLTFSADKSYYGDMVDINSDGILDLAFHFNTPRNPLKIRYGKGGGLYGIEQPIDLPPRHYMDIFQEEGHAPQIGMVLRNRLAFRLYGFVEKEQPALLAAQEIAPGRIGLEGVSKKTTPAWLASDFNQDGYDDLLIAAPELSRLHLYWGSKMGLNPEPKRIDTLSHVVRLSRSARGDVLVVSKKEKIAARHRTGELDQFPEILNVPGDVLAGCTIECAEESWFVCKTEDKELQLVRTLSPAGESSIYPLDLKNDPIDLLAFQLPENKVGILLFMAYDSPKMMLFSGGELEELTSESFRALTQQIKFSQISLRTPGKGDVLVVSSGAIARQFEWRGDRYEVTRQFNPENERGELVASCGYLLMDGSEGTLLYDRNSGDLVRFSADGSAWGKIHIPTPDRSLSDLVQLKNKDRDVFILIGRTGLNEICGNGDRLEPHSVSECVSSAESPLLAYAKLLKLGAPPRSMVALVDPANHTIELSEQVGSELKQLLSFNVFLTSQFANTGQTHGAEPHDIESGDLNGDGIGDLVVLSQDKLLIYLGE